MSSQEVTAKATADVVPERPITDWPSCLSDEDRAAARAVSRAMGRPTPERIAILAEIAGAVPVQRPGAPTAEAS